MPAAYIDESGCTGFKFHSGSSSLFVVSMVCYKNAEEYDRTRSALNDLRTRIGAPEHFEYRFKKLQRQRRLAALEAACDGKFWYHAFTLDKTQLWDGALRQKDSMYRKVVHMLVDNGLKEISNSLLVFDKCGNRDFYKKVRSTIEDVCEKRRAPLPCRMKYADSGKSRGLQVADLVAGAIKLQHSGNREDRDYWGVINGRELSNRYWPQK